MAKSYYSLFRMPVLAAVVGLLSTGSLAHYQVDGSLAAVFGSPRNETAPDIRDRLSETCPDPVIFEQTWNSWDDSTETKSRGVDDATVMSEGILKERILNSCHQARLRYDHEIRSVYCYPSTGGFWEVEDIDPSWLKVMGIDRPADYSRYESMEDEDWFCRTLQAAGANMTYFPSPMAHVAYRQRPTFSEYCPRTCPQPQLDGKVFVADTEMRRQALVKNMAGKVMQHKYVECEDGGRWLLEGVESCDKTKTSRYAPELDTLVTLFSLRRNQDPRDEYPPYWFADTPCNTHTTFGSRQWIPSCHSHY